MKQTLFPERRLHCKDAPNEDQISGVFFPKGTQPESRGLESNPPSASESRGLAPMLR